MTRKNEHADLSYQNWHPDAEPGFGLLRVRRKLGHRQDLIGATPLGTDSDSQKVLLLIEQTLPLQHTRGPFAIPSECKRSLGAPVF